MNDYFETRLELKPCCEDATDLLAAMLAEAGYESFVPDADGLTAYVKAEEYDPSQVEAAVAEFPMDCQIQWHSQLIEGQDWNAEWEKNYFQPIVVGDQCVIHSSFHTDFPQVPYEIVIDPKMAFGTGHHSTTSLMIEQLLAMDLQGRSLIDMGTGTGILAILAAMRGAKPVTGIEIDGFAHINAIENVKLNGHSEIRLINGDAAALAEVPEADVLLANINRNIIIADLGAYAQALKRDGTMLLSGFYEHDIDVILEAAKPLGLCEAGRKVKPDNWACLKLTFAPSR